MSVEEQMTRYYVERLELARQKLYSESTFITWLPPAEMAYLHFLEIAAQPFQNGYARYVAIMQNLTLREYIYVNHIEGGI